MALTYGPACSDELEILVAIRISAMKASLEKIGRFDPERARTRFADTFVPEATTNIILDKEIAGFYVLKSMASHLWLDHLYIKPECQGTGIGAKVLQDIIAEAKQQKRPLKLRALKESRANDFYIKHGFSLTHSEEWDNYYTHS